jgi:hypothetical protein
VSVGVGVGVGVEHSFTCLLIPRVYTNVPGLLRNSAFSDMRQFPGSMYDARVARA